MPTAKAVHAQVADRLCAASPCVKANRADFTVLGTLVRRGKDSARVQVEILAKGKKRAIYNRQWALAPGFAALADPDKALAEIAAVVGAGASPAPASPRAPAERPEESRGAPAPRPALESLDAFAAPAPLPAPSREEAPTVRGEAPAPVERSSPRPTRDDGLSLVEAWAGTDVELRSYGYADLKIANLRGFRANTVVLPSVNGRVRPLLHLGGPWARLRLEGGFASSVALRASIASRPQSYPASVTRVDAALRVDAFELPALGLGLEAFAGYRSHGFAVKPAADGSVLDGLAQPTWSALKLGATVTWRTGRVTTFLEGAALPVLAAGELQQTYFPRTAALGLEGRLGVDVALLPWLGIRLDGHATQYGARFTTADTDAYVASGATDLFAGASLGIRGRF